jgi:hypothetical protein
MQAPVVAKRSGVPVFVWILGGILVFLVACVLVFYFTIFAAGNALKNAGTTLGNTIGASASAAAFDLAMETGSYQEAYSYLGGNLAKNYSAATLQQKWEALQGAGSSFSVSTRVGAPRDIGNNQTNIDWIITPPNKPAVTVTLTMDQGTNDWKIIDAKPALIPNP